MNKQSIRTELERPSIRKFMDDNKEYLKGRVLDFGSGKQPYKDLIEDYTPYDLDLPYPTGQFDCIICNQVMQYVFSPQDTIWEFNNLLKQGGYLVLTYPTHWEELETSDLWRFTKAGMNFLLISNGFRVIKHDERCSIPFEDFKLSIGYGAIAQKC